MKRRILISNLNFYKQGHHIFYQNILFQEIHKYENEDRDFFFLFNDSNAKQDLINIHPNTFFLNEIENQELEKYKYSFRKYFVRWKFIQKYSDFLSIDEVFIMDFYEPYILPFLLNKAKFKIGGIVFRPYNRYFQLAVRKRSIGNGFTFLKKFLLFSLSLLKRKKVKRFLVFNDKLSAAVMTRYGRIPTQNCPDPINGFISSDQTESTVYERYSLEKDSKIILSFGAISEVKNISNLLDAVSSMKSKISVLIIGKPVNSYLEEYQKLKSGSLLDRNENLNNSRVIFDDRFIEDKELGNLISQSDIIYMVYKDFYFSSGNIGLAGKFGRICLVPDYGPMADLAKEFNLGVLVNPDSAEDIKRNITFCLENQVELMSSMKSEEFCRNFTYEKFANTILA